MKTNFKPVYHIKASVLRVQRSLEDTRAKGEIGSSLAAVVEMRVNAEDYTLIKSIGDDLRLVMITSEAYALQVQDVAEELITVTPSVHPKCERCWHYRQDIGRSAEHPTLCSRCVSNLFGSGEVRRYA